jgi:uncharacterized protein with NRDE domain
MCLVVFAWRASPDLRLAVAANRDEFHRRQTARAAFWTEAPSVLAGRDLEAGGTWMGVTRAGRAAFLTNHRDPPSHRGGTPSRGALVADFLRGRETAAEFVRRNRRDAPLFNGFHLVVGDADELWYLTNTGVPPRLLPPGVHGLSNGPLDDPWPKTVRSKERLETLLAGGTPEPGALLGLLADREGAPDGSLPSTGVPVEWERLLSAPFVTSPSYGTRSSTALIVTNEDVRFVERTFEDGRPAPPDVDVAFSLEDERGDLVGP